MCREVLVKVDIGGARIWFDVEGAKLSADGPHMRERPTLLLLHGGPGFDHSYFKPSHAAVVEHYLQICFPLYNPAPPDPDMASRSTFNPAMLAHFFRAGGEGYRFDFLPRLKSIRCPTLVLAGDRDPVTTMEDAEDMVAALPRALVQFER